MIVGWDGKPDNFLLKQVVGFSTDVPVPRAFSVGVVVIECPQCFDKSWFHVQRSWALAVREFAPHSPFCGEVRKKFADDTEKLEDALMEMGVFSCER